MSRDAQAEGACELDATELRLWAKARCGDQGARDELTALVTDVASVHSRRLGLPADDAEEVASRLRLSVLQLLVGDGSAPKVNLRGWLRYRYLAVTKAFFRQQKKNRALAPLLDDDDRVAPAPEYGTLPEHRELQVALAKCLDQLPETQRRAVLLRYGSAHSIEESKEVLATTNANTIRIWVFRGIVALRACLQTRGVT